MAANRSTNKKTADCTCPLCAETRRRHKRIDALKKQIVQARKKLKQLLEIEAKQAA